MPASGDTKALAELVERLRSSERLIERAAELAASAFEARVELQFDHGVDPKDDPWAPLAPSTLARGRKPPPLTATREMREHSTAKPRGVGGVVVVTIDKPSKPKVPSVHQGGAPGRNIPARPMLPEGELPGPWKRLAEASALQAVEEHFDAEATP